MISCGCPHEHHAAGLVALDTHEHTAERVRLLRDDPSGAAEVSAFTARERALLRYALLLNGTPADVREADVR